MADPGPVRIQPTDVDVPPSDRVAIRNTALANNLMKNPQEALDLLSKVAPVKMEDIELDESGRVVVTNAAFARGLGRLGQGGGARPGIAESASNGVCGVRC